MRSLADDGHPSVSHCVSSPSVMLYPSLHLLYWLLPLPLLLCPLLSFANCSSKRSPSRLSVSVCSCLIPLSLRGAPLPYRCLTEAPFWGTPFHFYSRICVCVCAWVREFFWVCILTNSVNPCVRQFVRCLFRWLLAELCLHNSVGHHQHCDSPRACV